MARGKRNRGPRDAGGEGNIQKRRVNERDEAGNGELVVYRILCPDSVIGSVIGKGGKVINAIRQDSKAKVKVVDPFLGTTDRVVTIYCHVKEKEDVDVEEEFDEIELVCAAQEALFRMHNAIAGAVGMIGDSDQKRGEKEECRILVPSSQSAAIIGKGGSTIKRLRSESRASIKVTPKDASDPTHSCAMDFDNFVTITGDSDAVKKALFAISLIMYKFGPKEEVPLETSTIEAPPSIIIPSDVPLYPPGGLYPNSDPILPSRPVTSIFGAPHVPQHQGFRDTTSSWPVYSSTQLPMAPSFGNDSVELKLKVLCPRDKIGRVIGKGGSTIKSIRQASGARIDVDDNVANHSECIITINANESPDDLKSMTVEAVLLLQEKINDEDEDTVTMQLLIPSKVIGCIIGRSGSIITEMRRRTNADIQISRSEKSKHANASDESVEVTGEVSNVRDALVQIVLRLRDDVLKPKESVRTSVDPESIYSGGAGLSVPSLLPSISTAAPISYEQRVETGSGSGLLSSSGLYGYGAFPVGESGYNSISSYSPSNLYRGLPATSTLQMLVPGNAVGKVLGKGGTNITNIRKISGATVDLSDPHSARGDRIALISGTAEQKRAAENLIQAFIMAT